MQDLMGTVKLPFYARLALTLFAVVLSFFILTVAKNIFVPLVFGLLIAILLYPLSRFLEGKMRLGKLASSIICVVLFISALVGFLYFLALQLIGFSSDFPQLRKRFLQMFDSLQYWLSYTLHITSKQQSDYMNKSVNSILETTAHSLSNVFVSVADILLLMIFIFIFTFFILYHRRLLMQFVLHLFSPHHREKVKEVVLETRSMINAYVVGLVIEMILISIVNSTVFLILGIQFAVLLGVMSAVLNIIPYLGIYTSIVICMVVTLANSTGNMALAAGVSLFVVHLVDSNILFPRIIGGRVKMNPFITIIAVITGEFVWGISGMFLFIPLMGIMKLICERVEGLEAWAILIGVDDYIKPKRKIKPEPPAKSTS